MNTVATTVIPWTEFLIALTTNMRECLKIFRTQGDQCNTPMAVYEMRCITLHGGRQNGKSLACYDYLSQNDDVMLYDYLVKGVWTSRVNGSHRVNVNLKNDVSVKEFSEMVLERKPKTVLLKNCKVHGGKAHPVLMRELIDVFSNNPEALHKDVLFVAEQ